MEENKNNAVSQKTSFIDDGKIDESQDIASAKNNLEPSQESKHNKGIIKKILIAAGILIVFIGGYLAYSQYRAALEARRIDVVFKDDNTEYELGTELKDLVTVNKANQVSVKLIDENGNEVDVPKADVVYKAVYTCQAADNIKEVTKEIKFVDTIAPLIDGVIENVTLEFGAEYDPKNGVVANDHSGNVKLKVEGVVDTNVPGEYVIRYIATDGSGNQTIVESTVIVSEPTCGVSVTWDDSLWTYNLENI